MLCEPVTDFVTSVQICLNKRSTMWKILEYKVNMGCSVNRSWIRVKGTIMFWLVFCPICEVGNKFYLCFSRYLWLLQLHNFCKCYRILVFTLTIPSLALSIYVFPNLVHILYPPEQKYHFTSIEIFKSKWMPLSKLFYWSGYNLIEKICLTV